MSSWGTERVDITFMSLQSLLSCPLHPSGSLQALPIQTGHLELQGLLLINESLADHLKLIPSYRAALRNCGKVRPDRAAVYYSCEHKSVAAKLTADKFIWIGESSGSSSKMDYTKHIMRVWVPQSAPDKSSPTISGSTELSWWSVPGNFHVSIPVSVCRN